MKNASGKRSEQVCTAGSHCCSACKIGSQPVQPGHGVVKHSSGHHTNHTRLKLCTRCRESLRLRINASNKRSEQVCTAGRHCCPACKIGSQPVLPGHGVVKHSSGHHTNHTRLKLCTRCSESFRLQMNASFKRSEQVCTYCTAGRHCRFACKTG